MYSQTGNEYGIILLFLDRCSGNSGGYNVLERYPRLYASCVESSFPPVERKNMTISIPLARAYYPARTGLTRILCWLPKDELMNMINRGDAPDDIIEDFPSGLEIEVSAEALDEYEIKLGFPPESICRAYSYFMDRGSMDKSGLVDGASLERILEQALMIRTGNHLEENLELVFSKADILTKPGMSDGSDPNLQRNSFRE